MRATRTATFEFPWKIALAGVVVVAFVGLIAYAVWAATRPVVLPGVEVPIMNNIFHIQPGEPHEPYNSDPPTSGQHWVEPAEAGFYSSAPADEQLIHNLEHGYVVIYYNCTALDESRCTALKDGIRDTMAEAGNTELTRTPKTIAAPRPGMDAQVAATSWGRLYKSSELDRQELLTFIQDFRNLAPEGNIP